MLTLLLELNVICEQKWTQFELQNSPSRVFVFDGKVHYHLANLRNRITTKIIFRIITLKQQKFCQSNPVPIRQFSKKLQSDPVLIRVHLCCLSLRQHVQHEMQGNVLKVTGSGRCLRRNPTC